MWGTWQKHGAGGRVVISCIFHLPALCSHSFFPWVTPSWQPAPKECRGTLLAGSAPCDRPEKKDPGMGQRAKRPRTLNPHKEFFFLNSLLTNPGLMLKFILQDQSCLQQTPPMNYQSLLSLGNEPLKSGPPYLKEQLYIYISIF